MAKTIEYSTEKELDIAVEKLLKDDPHGASIAQHIKIAGCFCIRMEDDQTFPGKGDPVTLKKVPPEMQILMRPKASFVLVVDYHFWQTASDEKKLGHLGLAISRIRVEKGENGLKVGTRKFDIQTNISVISRYGLYTDNLSLMGETVSKLNKQQLHMAQAVSQRMQASPAQKNSAEKNDAPAASEVETEEKTRPPRRPPPDPEPAPVVVEEEPEPED